MRLDLIIPDIRFHIEAVPAKDFSFFQKHSEAVIKLSSVSGPFIPGPKNKALVFIKVHLELPEGIPLRIKSVGESTVNPKKEKQHAFSGDIGGMQAVKGKGGSGFIVQDRIGW